MTRPSTKIAVMLRSQSFGGGISFSAVQNVCRGGIKSFLFFFSPQFSSKFENDQTHQKLTSGKLLPFDDVLFFFDEHQEKMKKFQEKKKERPTKNAIN